MFIKAEVAVLFVKECGTWAINFDYYDSLDTYQTGTIDKLTILTVCEGEVVIETYRGHWISISKEKLVFAVRESGNNFVPNEEWRLSDIPIGFHLFGAHGEIILDSDTY